MGFTIIIYVFYLKSYYNTISIKYVDYNSKFTKGMVVKPILGYFLNNTFNSAYFTLEFWI